MFNSTSECQFKCFNVIILNRCSKIVPCPDAPHQTCGCKEPKTATQAPIVHSVVYNIDTTDKGIMGGFPILVFT